MKVLFLIIFLFGLPFVSPTNDLEISMIADVIQSGNKASNIIANLCWKPSMKKKLMSKLFASDNPKSIKFKFSLHSKDETMKEKIVFLLDITCPEANEILKQANDTNKFGKPYRWFLVGNATFEDAPSELDGLLILPDSEVYVAKYIGNNSFNINLVYKRKRHSDWTVENYGSWSNATGLIRSNLMDVTATMRRKNLAGETIVTTMVVTDNSTMEDLENLRLPQIDSVTKSAYHQLGALYHFMNASRELILTDAWGYFINGSWNGMIGDLVEEKAELMGVVIFITKQRLPVLEYLTHPTTLDLKIVFREPPLSYQSNLYLLPFKATVWYSLMVLVAILIVSLYVSAFWEAKKNKNKEEHDNTTTLIPNISEVTVFVMSAISQQGNTVEFKGALGRFVTLILLMVCLFLYTAYSASIVVLLQASSNQIRTLTDLLESKLEVGSEDTAYNRYLLAAEKEPIRKMIYDKKIAPPGSKPKFYDLVQGVHKLQKDPFAFNCNLGSAYKVIERYFFEHEKCGLQEISFVQDNVPWQACRKGSPYMEIFKVGLLRNAELGLNDRTNRRLFSKKPICSARGGSFVSVSLVDCYPPLLLLLYGMILSVVLLLVELLYNRRTTHTA